MHGYAGAFECRVLLRQLPHPLSEFVSPGRFGALRAVPQRGTGFRCGLLFWRLRRSFAQAHTRLLNMAAGANSCGAADRSAGAQSTALATKKLRMRWYQSPLYWQPPLARGFNQADLLARGIARRILADIPVLPALRRLRPTATQAGLSNSARRKNVVRAFRSRSVQGQRILLIDDVMTTGATAAACALALKQGGARRVCLLTLARVDRRTGRKMAPEGV